MVVAIFIVIALLLIVGGSYAHYVHTQRKEARERKEQERQHIQTAREIVRNAVAYAKAKKQDEEFAKQLTRG